MRRIKNFVSDFFSNAMGVFALLIICATIVAAFNEDFAKNGLKDVYIMIVTGLAGLTEPHSLFSSDKNKNQNFSKRTIDKAE